MGRQISSLVAILILATVGWTILGSTTALRTETQDGSLRPEVGRLWGTEHKQKAPRLYLSTEGVPAIKRTASLSDTATDRYDQGDAVIWDSSSIDATIDLEHRKKGLLWYSTYRVDFHGYYVAANHSEQPQELLMRFDFPIADGVYDNFALIIGGDTIRDLRPVAGGIEHRLKIPVGGAVPVEIKYASQGMDKWWYLFGNNVAQIRNFRLTIHTNFDDINFPENSISPTTKSRTAEGWDLMWQYESLFSGLQIGLEMPEKINPGPFVTRVSFFAPASLLFYFFVMLLLTTVKQVRIHPINYAFVAAAFFAFHLLLAYLADHIDIHLAAAISSAVSIFLVISYLRLVVGIRFALVEAGISQFIFLIGFSYAFFLKGFTGLTITICAIITLFVAMQYTGRLDWSKAGEAQKSKS